MDIHILGIILSVLGISGFIYTGVSTINDAGFRSVKTIIFSVILEAIFFFTGISLI